MCAGNGRPDGNKASRILAGNGGGPSPVALVISWHLRNVGPRGCFWICVRGEEEVAVEVLNECVKKKRRIMFDLR